MLANRGFDRVGVSPDIEKSLVEDSCLGEGGISEFGEVILEMGNR